MPRKERKFDVVLNGPGLLSHARPMLRVQTQSCGVRGIQIHRHIVQQNMSRSFNVRKAGSDDLFRGEARVLSACRIASSSPRWADPPSYPVE